MSLAEFIAATQSEMKSRIEEECRLQMLTLLEDSFSRKWTEYTDKAVASIVPLYTEGYGKLDFSTIPLDEYFKTNTSVDGKAILNSKVALIEFSSKRVYFIHCCVKIRTNSQSYAGSRTDIDVYLIDNYGFYHQPYLATKTKIDITKPVGTEKYLYPLSNTLIDLIKSRPYSVAPSYTGHSDNRNDQPGGDLSLLVMNLPEIRKAAAVFYEQTFAMDALKNENTALKARLRAIEDATPSEDLLGLEAAPPADR